MKKALDLRTLREVERELRSQVGGYRSDTVRGAAIHSFVQGFLLHWIGGSIQEAEESKDPFRKVAEGSGYARRMLGPAFGPEKRRLGRESFVKVVVYVPSRDVPTGGRG